MLKNSIKIMAIINTSPDSFSGDGIDVSSTEQLELRLRSAINQGADILDIGGQSTRPGAEIIDVEQEIKRVVPAIQLARRLTDLPISVDTFKPAVAKAALCAGANIVNDISGCSDPDMIELVKSSGAEIVIVHTRGTPQTMSGLTDYPAGVVPEVKKHLKDRAMFLIDHGIDAQKIIIDPGIGFAKTAKQSFELTKNLDQFSGLDYRVLYGASQKSFIGKALAMGGDMAPIEERAIGTVVVQAYAMQHGANIIRTHNVGAAVQTRTIVRAIQIPDNLV